MIPNQDHGRAAAVDGLKKLPSQRDVHHRNFVDDQDVGLNWIKSVT